MAELGAALPSFFSVRQGWAWLASWGLDRERTFSSTLRGTTTVLTVGLSEALGLWLHGVGALVPVSVKTNKEGSLTEAALGVEMWPRASGTGSLVLGGPSSHCEDGETEVQGGAGACHVH